MLNQRPDNKSLERVAQSKYDYCMDRMQTLQSSVSSESGSSAHQVKHVMAELHIDNQIKREAASSDYTPLHNAIHHGPAVTRDHRLSRTDSQISNGSTSSAGRSTTSIRSVSSTVSDNIGSDRTVHTVPPQLQRSIAQLQQKQQREQVHQHNSHTQPVGTQQSKYGPPSTQLPLPVQPSRTQPVGSNPQQCFRDLHGHSGNIQTSTNAVESNRLASDKQGGSVYKEVTIPTTLQRMDYIRDGYNKPRADRQECVTPSVIPPPKEFQESPALSLTKSNSAPNDARSSSPNTRLGVNHKHLVHPQPKHNSSTYNNHTNGMGGASYMKPTSSATPYSRSTSIPTHDIYRDLPPKQSINKQNIRDILMQDMLKRQGQQGPQGEQGPQGQQGPQGHRPPNKVETLRSVSSQVVKGLPPKQPSYTPQFDEPLWTPPQQTSYDRGLSHYDRPNYQRQNLYGQVHSQPTTKGCYSSNELPRQSLVSSGFLQ